MTNGEIIKWLESPEGEFWSSSTRTWLYNFVTIKDDSLELQNFDGFLWYA